MGHMRQCEPRSPHVTLMIHDEIDQSLTPDFVVTVGFFVRSYLYVFVVACRTVFVLVGGWRRTRERDIHYIET